MRRDRDRLAAADDSAASEDPSNPADSHEVGIARLVQMMKTTKRIMKRMTKWLQMD